MGGIDEESTNPEDVESSHESAVQPRGRLVTSETLVFFRKLRERVMRGRRFSVDSTDLIEQARVERTAEL